MPKKSNNKKQMVLLIVLVLFAALFLIGYVAKDRQAGRKIVANGDQAPEFRLQAMDGSSVNLSDFRGKVVMVHFWATWCPPCVEELPTLDKLYRTVVDKDFQLLAVSVDEGGAPAVAAFLKKNGLNLPVLLDPDRTIAGLYGTYKFPETYIVDRQGVVRYKVIGPRDWSDPANVKLVRDALR
jgi:cytochrome c biogenesis protein CcmG/thiol:disulfide interchange protein DsbE